MFTIDIEIYTFYLIGNEGQSIQFPKFILKLITFVVFKRRQLEKCIKQKYQIGLLCFPEKVISNLFYINHQYEKVYNL